MVFLPILRSDFYPCWIIQYFLWKNMIRRMKDRINKGRKATSMELVRKFVKYNLKQLEKQFEHGNVF